jgi:hypothetical protein
MPAIAAAREAYVANHTDETAARDQRAESVTPNVIQLIQKPLVVSEVPQLIRAIWILLEVPIGGRRENEVN